MTHNTPQEWSRLVHLLIVGGIAVGVFFLGTTHLERGSSSEPTTEIATKAPGKLPARSYKELREKPYKANAASLATLEELGHDRTPGLRSGSIPRALEERASTRAYAGAPPVVPHPVKQRGDLDCMSCHRDGIEIAGRVAPAMSHEFQAACTQCHVPAIAPAPTGDPDTHSPPYNDNAFIPLAEAEHGERAWLGAPPTIPHSTHMREQCLSCHGAMGQPAMRTSHPERVQCTQCHAPSAEFDQRGADIPFP